MARRRLADSFGPIEQPGPKAWHHGLDPSGSLGRARKARANLEKGLHNQGKMDRRRGMAPRDKSHAYSVGYKAAGKWQTPITHAHSGGGKGGWNEADHPRNANGEWTNK